MEILHDLKEKAEYLANKVGQSEAMSQMIGYSNGTGDEQLLEGLPADDFGGKLF